MATFTFFKNEEMDEACVGSSARAQDALGFAARTRAVRTDIMILNVTIFWFCLIGNRPSLWGLKVGENFNKNTVVVDRANG
jgi:hypothetical protein